MSEFFDEQITQSRLISWKYFGKKVFFYAPSFVYYENNYFRFSKNVFPSISVTGKACSLNCGHCGGRLLETMIPATSPKALVETCRKIKSKGAVGCLISGGCSKDGSVPIAKFIEAISEAKRLGLTIVVHTGLVSSDVAMKLKEAGVDAVSIDIIGSEDTSKEICNIEVSVEDYRQSLSALKTSGINFTPHLLIGLHYGVLRGEMNALKMIAESKPSALIFIVFFPIKGTKMENVQPPSQEAIAKILFNARFMMPKVPMALGCARPKGKQRTNIDVLAIKAGMNALAFPSVDAITMAQDFGLEIHFSNLCCSQIFRDVRSIVNK